MAVILTGTSGTLSAVNIITTVAMSRALGMTMFRLPILVWNLFMTSFMVLLAFPVLGGALMLLMADRHFGSHFYDSQSGGSPILWQHLFWFFGHLEVYIIALPFFAATSMLIAVPTGVKAFNWLGTM